MKISIIGAGNVGGTLGSLWARNGHQVVFGSRNPESAAMKELLAKAGNSSRAATNQEAAASSEIVLLATPWPATRDVVSGLHLREKF